MPNRAHTSRPSASQRGYDSTHKRLRARWKPKVETGTIRCARCGELIAPTDTWDLGHDDRDRSRYTGPEHARCNRATKSHLPPRKREAEPHPGATPGG